MPTAPTLLRPWVARLLGFAGLAVLGALQWRRMVEGVSGGRVLLWVLLAIVAAAAVLATGRLRGRRAGWAPLGVALVALAAAFAAAPLELGLLRISRWEELGTGLAGGAQALGTLRLPYVGADPWPGTVLSLLGAVLCVLAGLLAFWPREPGRAGYPFLSLAALLTLIATPVVTLGGALPVLLGLVVTALIICFLWLERLQLRPGIGFGVLLALAAAGAVPLATAADHGAPWFDYRGFAEGLGPDRVQRFHFDSSRYGPIDWPRDGGEVLRVRSNDPQYLKMAVLDRFDGENWASGDPLRTRGLGGELPPAWRAYNDWRESFEVEVRGLRDLRLPGAGTVLRIADGARPAIPGAHPGTWVTDTELRGGDSYRVNAYVPQPSGETLASVSRVGGAARTRGLQLGLSFAGGEATAGLPTRRDGSAPERAVVRLPAFGEQRIPLASYPELGHSGDGGAALRASTVSRTWALAQRLRAEARTPYEYVLAVDDFLERGFEYNETPPEPAAGAAALDAFIHDSRAGYCQHFAGAMALMLRMGGVPARVVNGFSPGGFSDRKDAWVVRDTDAHAWVEAWFDGLGWVAFDPTPPLTPARSLTAAVLGPAAVGAEAAGTGGAVAREPRPSGPDAVPAGAAEMLEEESAAAGAEREGMPRWTLALAALGIFTGGGWWVARRRNRRLARADAAGALERAVAELEPALRRAGRPLPPAATLRHIELRMSASGEAHSYVRALRRARYGGGPVPAHAAGRRALRRELGAGGGLRGRVRALWALPPRP